MSAVTGLGGRRAGAGRALLAVAVAALAGACTLPGAGQAEAWPPSPPVVEVAMDEYAFEFATPVPAGRVVFRFTNVGEESHQAALVPLPEDLPPLDEQLHGDQRRDVPNFAEIHPRRPGEGGAFTVDLEPGRRYGLICFQEDDEGAAHALQGMNAEFRAGGPDADPPDDDPPDADLPDADLPDADPPDDLPDADRQTRG